MIRQTKNSYLSINITHTLHDGFISTMTQNFRYFPAFCVMVAIFVVSHIPGNELHPPKFIAYDKFWHVLEYFILASTLLYAKRPAIDHFQQYALIVFYCLIFAISDEIHQSFIPFRFASIMDILADGLGALLAVSAWNLINRWRRYRRELFQI